MPAAASAVQRLCGLPTALREKRFPPASQRQASCPGQAKIPQTWPRVLSKSQDPPGTVRRKIKSPVGLRRGPGIQPFAQIGSAQTHLSFPALWSNPESQKTDLRDTHLHKLHHLRHGGGVYS